MVLKGESVDCRLQIAGPPHVVSAPRSRPLTLPSTACAPFSDCRRQLFRLFRPPVSDDILNNTPCLQLPMPSD